jgi:hypothetical protein
LRPAQQAPAARRAGPVDGLVTCNAEKPGPYLCTALEPCGRAPDLKEDLLHHVGSFERIAKPGPDEVVERVRMLVIKQLHRRLVAGSNAREQTGIIQRAHPG